MTQKTLKKIKSIIFGILWMIFTAFPMLETQASSYYSDSNQVIAYGIDTVAGFSALIKTKETRPDANIEFWIKKPDNGELFIESQTNDEGIAVLDLYDYHTKKAGFYQVAARFKKDSDFGPVSTFRVYASDISAEKSSISLDKNTAIANGYDTATLTANLMDVYGNPLPNHTLEVLSSRSNDTITKGSQYFTNDAGIAHFALSSEEPGVSVYTIFDSTAGVTLKERAKIAYYPFSGGQIQSIGGNVILAQEKTANNDFLTSSLKIENIPEQVEPNTVMTFTVTAYTESKNTSTNYSGTIHFSSSDTNASLPQDYSFTPKDLGTHTFSLALTLLSEGTQTIEINDIGNPVLKDEKIVQVGSTHAAGETVKIITPREGTYGESEMTLEGEAPTGKTMEIYDNDEKIGQTMAGADNRFRFTMKNLTDGLHTLYITLLDDNQKKLETSEKVTITVDTQSPIIDAITTVPDGNLPAGQKFRMTIITEPTLEKVSIILENNLFSFIEDIDQKGTYAAEIDAPKTPGEYPIDIILADRLGNESSYQSYSTLKIVEEIQSPSKVTGLTAQAEERRIILSWENGVSDTISHYRIYYGKDENNLDQTVDTQDSNTSWYIPDLEPGKEYFFAITALDEQNNESMEQSEKVSAMPLGIVYPEKVQNVQVVDDIQKVTITWEPSQDDTYISSYRIHYGTEENALKGTVNTYDNQTSWYISELVGDVTYYFAVTAIDSDGNESLENSDIVKGFPKSPPSPPKTPDNGPSLNLIIILSLLGGETYLLKRYWQWKKSYALLYSSKTPLNVSAKNQQNTNENDCFNIRISK
ncbi:fibronectin type III domain-containing protein [Candidatus Peregrinibacteria bacterium]|nr:fibronectin type III domain-containing protein [Candidatus Peregrinibacteria bacterium]